MMFNIPTDYFNSSPSSPNLIYHPYPISYYPDETYAFNHHHVIGVEGQIGAPHVFKRRITANKKERRRTQSFNTAFSDLRTAIPNVQPDTKLSKIKTLKLATRYIEYLLDILSKDDCTTMPSAFKTEIIRTRKDCRFDHPSYSSKIKERTGWQQTLWQSGLNVHQYNSSSRLPSSHFVACRCCISRKF